MSKKAKITRTKQKIKTAATIGNGWITTDEEEVERRRLRALEDNLLVKVIKLNNKPPNSIYADYLVSSVLGGQYKVEYRDKHARLNSCNCPDHQVNGLGTCKHIERVSRFLLRKKIPPYRSCTEIFVNRSTENSAAIKVEILWADRLRANSKVKKTLESYFSADNSLLIDNWASFKALQKSVCQAGLGRERVKMSDNIQPYFEYKSRIQNSRLKKEIYLKDVANGKRQLNVVNPPLYDYQRQGMLHLAFNERAILADDMGLGKTVQAVAACELLQQLQGIERVLVISPVSLKTEWEEQIAKFTGRDSLIIQGNRANRLKLYQKQSFFYLANYEQLLFDLDEVQNTLMPDVIILDEAQRVKNWQTKTAQAIKQLSSPYVFVLTGTPLENRIDEIYSIAQVVDPHILGPLFRFNRDFHKLNDNGKPEGYKNLDKLHQKLRPILLRRRKQDVEGELPDRVVNTYFVEMEKEQAIRYEEYKSKLAKILHKAKHQLLTPDEYKRIQMCLACMRMLCDTPYILDQTCRISPKLDELKKILAEQLQDPTNKIIIFSEWTKMLDLIREYLDGKSIGYALHTGQVHQKKRRIEINRFKNNETCRLFLSSDAGATGLNLQAANVVINMDLPWNPAKLEQRIARAWRKQQTRQVNVINLVCESSIEHRMLSILAQKTVLAEGVLDGIGEPDMDMPSGRKVLIERLEQVMGGHAHMAERESHQDKRTSQPVDDFYQEVKAKHPQLLESLSQFENEQQQKTLFAVVKGDREQQSEQLQLIADAQAEPVINLEVIDESTMATIQRLIDAGILSLNDAIKELQPTASKAEKDKAKQQVWRNSARKRVTEIDRKFQMAELLFNGGFVAEALAPTVEVVELCLSCLYQAVTGKVEKIVALSVVSDSLAQSFELSEGIVSLLTNLRKDEYQLEVKDMLLLKPLLINADQKMLALCF